MLLQHQTWQEVETYLGRSNGIIMPIGSTEQHGPNGLIGTDAICAEVIARAVGDSAERHGRTDDRGRDRGASYGLRRLDDRQAIDLDRDYP